ncbi:MAG: DUF3375 family protein [Bacteroidia bacterium]|nr:DUF3375 family protein [Bacteroidia bacterium]
MNTYSKIVNFLNSPVVKFLQKDNAVLILSFLYNEYKLKGKPEIQKFELIRLLDLYLIEIRKENNGKFSFTAKEYIEFWQKDETPYLQTNYFNNELNDWMVEPTITVRRIFRWVDDPEDNENIDAEIGFLNILNTMKKIVFGTLIDPNEKLSQLNAEKKIIENQIAIIEDLISRGEKMEQIDSHQILSKYANIVRDSKRLINDFDEISNKYKKLKTEIKDKYNVEKLSRGAVLGSYLETDSKLQENSLVKSYRAFRAYLRPESEDQLEDLIERIHSLPQIKPIEDRFVSRLTMHLGGASKKVGHIDGEIFNWVKTMFDEKFQENAKQIYALTQDIKRIVIENKTKFPEQKKFIEIEAYPEIFTDRFLFVPTTKIKFSERIITQNAEDFKDDIFDDIKNRFSIDETELRANLLALTKTHGSITLTEVVKKHPIKKGLPEVIAYIKIATSDNLCLIDRTQKETIIYDTNYSVDLPLITFKNELE